MIRTLILCTCLTGTTAFADTQAIRDGTDPATDQIGHVFMHFCEAGNLALMNGKFETAIEAFRWEPLDMGTDLAAISPMGAITVSLDGNPFGQTCTMAMHPDVAGDGSEIYDSLEAHLADRLDGDLPPGEAIDGGLRWSFEKSRTPFTLDFYMGEGVSITLSGGE